MYADVVDFYSSRNVTNSSIDQKQLELSLMFYVTWFSSLAENGSQRKTNLLLSVLSICTENETITEYNIIWDTILKEKHLWHMASGYKRYSRQESFMITLRK